MPTWRLVDADQIAEEFRYTFYKPSRELISRVVPGELVKLIFEFDSDDPAAPAAERMWVLVEEVLADGWFKGRLNNEPDHIHDLQCDDPLTFAACHIINTQHDDPDNLVARYLQRCFVTRRVLNDGAPVGYLYREAPDAADDSGWRITANDESDEYLDASGNIAYVSLGAVLNQDDSFVNLLDAPAGAAFFRDPRTGQLVAKDQTTAAKNEPDSP